MLALPSVWISWAASLEVVEVTGVSELPFHTALPLRQSNLRGCEIVVGECSEYSGRPSVLLRLPEYMDMMPGGCG